VNITFCNGMLLQLDLSTSSPTIVSKQGIGTATIDFYNYFSCYRSSPKEEFLNLLSRPDKEVLEIISEQSLANQFFLDYANSHQCISTKNQQDSTKEALTYTCNLIQSAFSDLNAVFSECSNVYKADMLQSDKALNLFKFDKFTASFVLLGNKIVLVYTVNSLYEYLELDFYHANLAPDSVKYVSICPCCGRAFRMSQRNNLYCSKACKDKSIRANNKKTHTIPNTATCNSTTTDSLTGCVPKWQIRCRKCNSCKMPTTLGMNGRVQNTNRQQGTIISDNKKNKKVLRISAND